MSHIRPTSPSSSDFQLLFNDALKAYEKRTKNDLLSHPLAAQLQACESPSSILAVLQERLGVQELDQSRTSAKMLSKCLEPTVNVLYAFSGTIGEGLGLVLSANAKVVLTAVGVLLSAAKDVRSSQETLIDLFERIESFFRRLEAYTGVPPTPEMMDMMGNIMTEVLSILGIATKEMRQGRFKNFQKKLIGRADLEESLKRLDYLTQKEARVDAMQDLKAPHAVDNRASSALTKVDRYGDEVKEVDDRGQMKRSQLRQAHRRWLSPSDPSTNHNIACAFHHEGTAEWFLQGSIFREWKISGSLLWVHGKPGSGKSVLCSTVVNDITPLHDSGLASMAYFYYNTGKQNCHDLLTSIIIQLSARSDPYCNILSSLYLKCSSGSELPSKNGLIQCLKEMVALPDQPPVYIIIDALDECSNLSGFPSPRKQVLDLLENLVDLSLPNLHVCVTSRPEIDIRIVLEPLTSHRVSLHDQHGQKKDIVDYITSIVHSDRNMRRWRDEDRRLVIETLSQRADGMFRWVSCQLGLLRSCLLPSVRPILNEFPETLDETYERILREIPKSNQGHAHRLLQCLIAAARPLLVAELAEVLAVDFGMASDGVTPQLNPDLRWEDQEIAVLSACSSLIAVVEGENGSRVVQFSHFSVKEFLTSDRLATSSTDVSHFRILLESAHTSMAMACLGTLLQLDSTYDGDNVEAVEDRFPLARYAAEFWVTHTQFMGVSTRIREGMETLFDPDKPHFSAWIRVYDIDVKHTADTSNLWHFSPYHKSDASPLYYAALCGFRDLAQHLIYKFPQQVNAIGGFYVSPLAAAVAMEHFEVAELLYSHGANVDVLGDGKLTPLYGASCAGRLEIVQWLLQHGAAPSAFNKDGFTGPLHLTALHGHLDLSWMLVKRGASVAARDKDGNTPLHLAVLHGHKDLAQMLLKYGANVSAQAKDGRTPLHLAALHGHEDLARLLIKRGADLLAQAEDGSAPLHLASLRGHVDLARILVEHGADVVAQDKDGSTPLLWAARSGHIDLARLLIANGADSSSQDKGGLTPLLAAAKPGHNERALTRTLLTQDKDDSTRLRRGEASPSGRINPVSRLLEFGANATVHNNDRSIPLRAASESGHVALAQFRVAHSATMTAQHEDWLTPLHGASGSGHVDLMRFRVEDGADTTVKGMGESTPLNPDLVESGGNNNLGQSFDEHGADVTAQDLDGSTQLHWASQAGNIELARFLLKHGADATVQDKDGSTPLHWVSLSGHVELAQLLIEHGADATAQGKDGSTPLHWASQTRHVEFAQFLVQQGVDVKAQDQDGSTPLHWASRAGQIDLAGFLVESGANVTAQDMEGFTPPHLASQSGHINLTQFFVEMGVDMTAQDEGESTPLHRASQNGHVERTLALLGRGADANSRDENDVTPLHLASRFGHLGIVRSLLKHGASSSPRDESDWTPLHVASEEGRLEIVRLLLDQGDSVCPPVDLNVENEDQQTPLFLASRSGRLEVAKFLLECGVDFEHHDWLKRTPLHVASRNGHCDVTHLLLEKGVSVNAKDERLWSPLHMASKKGQRMVIQELLDRGAEVGSQNDLCRTPLHMASQEGHLEVVQLLLRYGADVDKLDVDEETALHLAAYYGHPKVTELLLKHDAKVYNRNKKGETPFDLASKEGHQDVANLLTVGFWEIVWDVVLAVVRLLLRL